MLNINKFYTKFLAKKFPLPENVPKVTANPNDNNKDVASIVSELMREREDLRELVAKFQLRRDEKENEELEQFLKSILPFLDGLERILKVARNQRHSEEVANWVKAIESLYFRLINILEKQGLEPIDSIGKPVDLNLHEVVEYIPSKDAPHNTVIAERQRGYIFRGKVIRDAKVVVSYKEGSD
ncbi:MAG: nucleotide exchange factor GrpE [Candidatus Sumerlaeia bacterium]|nr:nucleotide exchange factor GrpE [Candidatus Sumerlaeia bacterium]